MDYLISSLVVALAFFAIIGWPIYPILILISLLGAVQLIDVWNWVITNPTLLMLGYAKLVKDLERIASKINWKVKVEDRNNLRIVTLGKNRYYLHLTNPIQHRLIGVTESDERVDITAAQGTDYQITSAELGYSSCILNIGDHINIIESDVKISLKLISDLQYAIEEETLFVD